MLQLKKFPDIPVSTPEEARGSGDLQRSSVSTSKLEMRDPSLLPRERIPDVSDASQEEARCTGKARGTHGSCHHSKSLQMSPSIPEDPVFPALLRLSCRGSTHTTVARGTALRESLMGNLVGKHRGKATDPMILPTGSMILLLQLGRKAEVHASTRDEDSLLRGYSRSTPRSMSALERNPQVPAATPHKVLGPDIDGRGIPRGPRATRMGRDLN